MQTKGLSETRIIGLILFAGFAWFIWRTRNKMAIDQISPTVQLMSSIYTGVSSVQKWWRLLKPADQEKLEKTVEARRTG
jgi:hypothetical protein